GRELRGEVLHGAAGGVVLGEDAAHGIDDLVASAVADREVDVQAGVTRGARLGVLQDSGELGRQDVDAPHMLHPPAAVPSKSVGQPGGDLDEVAYLLRVELAQVVPRQQVQRYGPHPEAVADAQGLT